MSETSHKLRHNFSYLTAALVVLLLGTALADELGFKLGQLLIQSAIVGQFYIAILVASLVGIRIRISNQQP